MILSAQPRVACTKIGNGQWCGGCRAPFPLTGSSSLAVSSVKLLSSSVKSPEIKAGVYRAVSSGRMRVCVRRCLFPRIGVQGEVQQLSPEQSKAESHLNIGMGADIQESVGSTLTQMGFCSATTFYPADTVRHPLATHHPSQCCCCFPIGLLRSGGTNSPLTCSLLSCPQVSAAVIINIWWSENYIWHC